MQVGGRCIVARWAWWASVERGLAPVQPLAGAVSSPCLRRCNPDGAWVEKVDTGHRRERPTSNFAIGNNCQHERADESVDRSQPLFSRNTCAVSVADDSPPGEDYKRAK